MYFLLGVAILSWIPNINPDYPLFHMLFKFSGFYLLPPFMGLALAPALLMVVGAFLIMMLEKIYDRFYKPEKQQVYFMSSEEFTRRLDEFQKNKELQNKKEEMNDDSDKDN